LPTAPGSGLAEAAPAAKATSPPTTIAQSATSGTPTPGVADPIRRCGPAGSSSGGACQSERSKPKELLNRDLCAEILCLTHPAGFAGFASAGYRTSSAGVTFRT
jgi:hypothetical protein